MSLIKTTHGKKGVPELDVFVMPEEIESVRAMPCNQEKHVLMGAKRGLFEALCKGPDRPQLEPDGVVLYLLRTCPQCGTSVSFTPTAEARQRLHETPEETRSRHAAGGAL